MTVTVEWEKQAQDDRETIFRYLAREAGVKVAVTADNKLSALAGILKANPLAGVSAGRSEKQRKLVVPHFPFIIVYAAEKEHIRILRVLHTSQKIAGQYRRC
ncbi:type II toxin-antitoxin system RelE/ParE family toxin [Morganella morganii]|uniref:type II toxin-antitoxin system RelE/ParE family toxin n=1 Tax=Morganella morganii TaxID=582 RepID=UPI00387055D8